MIGISFFFRRVITTKSSQESFSQFYEIYLLTFEVNLRQVVGTGHTTYYIEKEEIGTFCHVIHPKGFSRSDPESAPSDRAPLTCHHARYLMYHVSNPHVFSIAHIRAETETAHSWRR